MAHDVALRFIVDDGIARPRPKWQIALHKHNGFVESVEPATQWGDLVGNDYVHKNAPLRSNWRMAVLFIKDVPDAITIEAIRDKLTAFLPSATETDPHTGTALPERARKVLLKVGQIPVPIKDELLAQRYSTVTWPGLATFKSFFKKVQPNLGVQDGDWNYTLDTEVDPDDGDIV